jgi:hypothetical protein
MELREGRALTATRNFVRDRPDLHRIAPGSRCVLCGTKLAPDHMRGDLICTCHRPQWSDPEEGHLALTLLLVVAAAHPQVVNVAKVLGIEGKHDRDRIARQAAWWRKQGVPVVGVRGHGYRLGS